MLLMEGSIGRDGDRKGRRLEGTSMEQRLKRTLLLIVPIEDVVNVNWKGRRSEGTVTFLSTMLLLIVAFDIRDGDWKGWKRTSDSDVVNWKGCIHRHLEGTSDSDVVAGRGVVSGRCSYLRCCC